MNGVHCHTRAISTEASGYLVTQSVVELTPNGERTKFRNP